MGGRQLREAVGVDGRQLTGEQQRTQIGCEVIEGFESFVFSLYLAG